MLNLLLVLTASAASCLHNEPTHGLATLRNASVPLDLKRAQACRDHRDYMRKAQAKRVPVNAVLDSASRSDIVFIGETHEEAHRAGYYRTLLRDLVRRDPKFNCVFVETDATSPGGQEFERCNQDPGRIDRSKLASGKDKACASGSSLWADLENEAYKLGLNVHAMDAGDSCMAESDDGAVVNTCRDNAMKDVMQGKLNSGGCTKAVAINGFPHLTSIFAGHKPLGQRPFVDKSGRPLKSFRLNVMFSTYEKSIKGYDVRWRWSDWAAANDEERVYICSSEDQPTAIEENYGFMHDRLPPRPFVWSQGRPAGNWSDFDATVVLGKDVP